MYGSCAGSNVILIQRGEYCIFRAFSYCMYNTKDRHYEIRLSSVNIIINEWEYCKKISWLCLRLITLKIPKIYFSEMGNIMEALN